MMKYSVIVYEMLVEVVLMVVEPFDGEEEEDELE
jgi:hypothetical protein